MVINLKEFMDRRKLPRFIAQNGAYAAINNDSLKVGQIQNISKGGLALRYLDNGKQTEGPHKVDIFVSDNDFYLKNLPVKIISDVYIDSKIPFSTTSIRQCSGQFAELTPSQLFQLDHFLKFYTLDKA